MKDNKPLKILVYFLTAVILLIIGVFSIMRIFQKKQDISVKYKETDLVRVLESRVSTHHGESGILFEVFVKTNSGVTVEQIQLVDKQKDQIVSRLKPGTVGDSKPICGRQNINFSGWTKHLTESIPLPPEVTDFLSTPLPQDKYIVNVIYRDKTGHKYLTRKEIEGICDVIME